MTQLALTMGRVTGAALCPICRETGATTADLAAVAPHGDCPGGPLAPAASRLVYLCDDCTWDDRLGLVAVAYSASLTGGGGCVRCGVGTRSYQLLEAGPRCPACARPVHRRPSAVHHCQEHHR